MNDSGGRVPSPQSAPILDYRSPTASPRVFALPDIPPGWVALLIGAVMGGLSIAYGKSRATPDVALLVAALFWWVWRLALRRSRGTRGGILVRTLLIGAATTMSVATLGVFSRAGEGGEGPGGLAYWTSINPRYRYNAYYALKPWPYVVGSAAALAALLMIDAGIKRRARSS